MNSWNSWKNLEALVRHEAGREGTDTLPNYLAPPRHGGCDRSPRFAGGGWGCSSCGTHIGHDKASTAEEHVSASWCKKSGDRR